MITPWPAGHKPPHSNASTASTSCGAGPSTRFHRSAVTTFRNGPERCAAIVLTLATIFVSLVVVFGVVLAMFNYLASRNTALPGPDEAAALARFISVVDPQKPEARGMRHVAPTLAAAPFMEWA